MKPDGIHVGVRTNNRTNTCQGYIVAYDNGKRLWQESTGIRRLNFDDAFLDALYAKNDKLYPLIPE